MPSRLRKVLTWVFFSVVVTVAIAVVGEWFIKVADDKGLYQGAGRRWDSLVDALSGFITSPWFLFPALVLTGAVAGMWLDHLLRRIDRSAGVSPEQVEAIVTRRLAEMPSMSVQEIENSLRQSGSRRTAIIERLSARLDQIEAVVKDAAKHTEEHSDALSSLSSELRSEVETMAFRNTRMRDAQDEFQERMEQWVSTFRESVHRQITAIDQGFLSILDREHLLDLAGSIEKAGDELSGPTNGNAIEDWSAWTEGYTVWRGYVTNWVRIAEQHRIGVRDRVLKLRDEDCRGEWKAKDEYFPSALAVQDYKTFRC